MTRSKNTEKTKDGGKTKGSWLTLATASLAFIGMAAVFGWTGSFIGLHGYAVQRMTGFTSKTAWSVPGAYDGAALACTFAVYRASINGRSAARGRVMMFGFTAISSWINWTHQTDHTAKIVAAGLPIAAVIVFDFLMSELRSDWEAAHGRRAFRIRPGLLALRYLVDRQGTKAAFRAQITAIPVTALAGLGADLAEAAEATADQTKTEPTVTAEPETVPGQHTEPETKPEPETVPAQRTEPDPQAIAMSNAVARLLLAEPPEWQSLTIQAAIERADAIVPDGPKTPRELVEILARVGVKTSEAYVRTVRGRVRDRDADTVVIDMTETSTIDTRETVSA